MSLNEGLLVHSCLYCLIVFLQHLDTEWLFFTGYLDFQSMVVVTLERGRYLEVNLIAKNDFCPPPVSKKPERGTIKYPVSVRPDFAEAISPRHRFKFPKFQVWKFIFSF